MSVGTIWTYRDVIKREQGSEAAIEFEQVVRKYQAEQIGYEQDRIIKLLKEQKIAYKGIMFSATRIGAMTTVYHWEDRIRFIESYIALIKGEQNV